jgi:uncharacterized protein (TIGR02996 family)
MKQSDGARPTFASMNSFGAGGNTVEEDLFIQSVHESPHDEDRRLIYADWLEERGDARYEFLRLENHLRRTKAWEPGYADALVHWLDCRDRAPAGWLDGLGWRVNGLLLPRALVDLLAGGRWQSSSEGDERGSPWGGVYAYSQKLMQTETTHVCYGLNWLGQPDTEHPPGDVAPKLTVLIADLGMGSDEPFALDYRVSFEQPRVLLYRWRLVHDRTLPARSEEGNRWVELARDFPAFCDQLRWRS